MFKNALYQLLSNRYELNNVQSSYEEVKKNLPKNSSEEMNIHMDKLNDIMANYSDNKAYELRNLISYYMIPLANQ